MSNSTNKRKEAIASEIMELLQNNNDLFIEVIEDLDYCKGYLGDDRYYDMDMLNEIYKGVKPLELLYRTFYGYDADDWFIDSRGEKQFGAFNPNRYYFTYNGYGNLVSTDYKDYSDKLDSYLIDVLAWNIIHLYTVKENEELRELLEKYNEL